MHESGDQVDDSPGKMISLGLLVKKHQIVLGGDISDAICELKGLQQILLLIGWPKQR